MTVGTFLSRLLQLSRVAAAACLVWSGVFCRLPAQEVSIVHTEGERQVCNVRVTAYGASVRVGGFGWVVVEAQNAEARPHVLNVRLATHDYSPSHVTLQRTLVLGPEEQAKFLLPLPNAPQFHFGLRIQVDSTTYFESLNGNSRDGLTGLLISDRAALEPTLQGVLVAVAGGDKPAIVQCSSGHAPSDWRMLTGFEVVFVDGRAPIAAEVQDALRRYVHSGGVVAIGSPASLPAGAARDAVAKGGVGASSYGLGTWIAAEAFERSTVALEQTLRARPRLRLSVLPLPAPMLLEQPVPGLGRAPVLVFLSVILGFAVLAGPVNFLLLRRWRRPLLALVTVPALGFGTTLLMLGYGFFHDGFGVRGVVRSWTLLDQRSHEVSAFAARTLFAGLSPSRLTLGAGSMVVSPAAFFDAGLRRSHRWDYDVDHGRIDGSVLPSRTPTALATAQQGAARERLRVRARSDGDLELLADGGIVTRGDVLLCDFEGRYWFGPAERLRPANDSAMKTWSQQFATEAGSHMVVDVDAGNRRPGRRYRHPGGEDGVPGPRSLEDLTVRMFGQDQLTPGTWMAQVAVAPWLDEHGLRVAYDSDEHFVIGRFAAEDFVR